MKGLIDQLERDQYDPTEGDAEQRAYRRGWNAGVMHAVGRIHIELGLIEFRRSCTFVQATSQDYPGVHDLFDLGGEA